MSGSNYFDAAASRARCLKIRRRLLDLSQTMGALHLAPAYSCLEILDYVYYGCVRAGIDSVLLSKGHGALSQYAILEDLGIMPPSELENYGKPTGHLGAHPDYGTPGILASTGSLGHGAGLAVGMALADRLQGHDRRVFVILSDGELQEGSSWEAIMMAANLKLDRLVLILDLNDITGLDRLSEVHPSIYPVAAKFENFGWSAIEANGHDAEDLDRAFRSAPVDKPLAMICRTVKGKGVSYMEHDAIWHYRSPNKAEYAQALAELREIAN